MKERRRSVAFAMNRTTRSSSSANTECGESADNCSKIFPGDGRSQPVKIVTRSEESSAGREAKKPVNLAKVNEEGWIRITYRSDQMEGVRAGHTFDSVDFVSVVRDGLVLKETTGNRNPDAV
jgi:hypothetical protein